MNTYSVEFARLILTAGSEIEVLSKVLCNQHRLLIAPDNIEGYRTAITSHFQQFTFLKICIPRFGKDFLPWESWHNGQTPDWWRAYNKIKHQRNINFSQANLKNALLSMTGLFTLVCYICHDELRANKTVPWPELLSLDPSLNSQIQTNLMPGYVLPDFSGWQN